MQDSKNFIGMLLDGRYMVTGVVGKGGSACVYKANDVILNREVALKILEDDKNEYRMNSRSFETEVKAIARLSHPNIVNVFDISMDGNIKYIIMEYVEGITLSSYLKHKKVLSVKESLSCARQVLRALKEAHEKGIVHRDIKPQNVMIMKNGQIKVADFGIARLPDKDSFAMEDRSIGTVHYISPEQARGNSVDARSDLYSLAIVMYEMLTGKRPFEADSSSDVIMMQVTDTPVRPSEINPELPKELDTVIMRALSKRPENRYESAVDMLRALERVSVTGAEAGTVAEKKENGIFAFFKKRKEKNRREPEKREEEKAPEELLISAPERIPQKSEEQFDELDDAEEDLVFTSPFDTDEVNDGLRFEKEPDESGEDKPVKIEMSALFGDTAVFEGVDDVEDDDKKSMQLVPVGPRYPEKYKGKPKYRLITAIALCLLVSLTLVFASILIYNGNKKYEVPLYTSEKAIGNDGIFSVQIEKREHSLIYPKGAVISQSVAAKEMRKKGTEILLTISEGPVSLHFRAEEGADAEFLLAGFSSQIEDGGYKITVVEKYEYSEDLEFGKCFAIDETVFDGTTLTVRISAGSEKTYVEIPDFVGKPISEAIEYLNRNNIVFDLILGGEQSVDTVTAQSIQAGKRTEAYVEDGKISLTVGKREN